MSLVKQGRDRREIGAYRHQIAVVVLYDLYGRLGAVESPLNSAIEFLESLPKKREGGGISNCVINLSADKDRVLREAFRVLKPGGRFAVSDVVTRGAVPEGVRQNMLLWVGCIAGALDDYEYVAKLAKAGFDDIDIEPTRVYDIEDARTFLGGQGVDVDAIASQVEGKFMSAFIRATKPASCCAPGCCV